MADLTVSLLTSDQIFFDQDYRNYCVKGERETEVECGVSPASGHRYCSARPTYRGSIDHFDADKADNDYFDHSRGWTSLTPFSWWST